jgi:hypothetical protein
MPSVIFKRALDFCRGALLLLLLAACARPAPTGSPMAVSFLPQTGEFLSSAGDPVSPEDLRRRAAPFAYVLIDRKSTRLNSSHNPASRMPSSA